MTLHEIAELLGGALSDPSQGDPVISGVASLDEATDADISFFVNPKYAASLQKTQAAAVIVPEGLDIAATKTILLRTANPAESFAKVLALFAPKPIAYAPGIHPSAIIAPDVSLGTGIHIGVSAIIESGVSIGEGSVISAGAYIGHGVSIGANCHIHPHVTVCDNSRIGSRVILHAGVVIGADGFGYESGPAGHKKIPQTGIVQIDDDVEIGANSTVDRARFGRTWIKKGTKIDNLCQVGHNVTIGEHSILCGLVGISGSARIGSGVILAGQAGVAGHIEIGDGAIVGPQSGVPKSIPSKGKFMGTPAHPMREFSEAVVRVYRLGNLETRVSALEKNISSAEDNHGK